MKTIRRFQERGHGDRGWLNARHGLSFAVDLRGMNLTPVLWFDLN